LTLALAFAAGSATAGPLGHHQMLSERFDSHVERLAERLDLSGDQEQQVRTILEEQHAAADRQREETRRRIDAVLTEAQRAERQRLMGERMERRVERLAERLDLSPEQETQVRAIVLERRADPTLTPSEIRTRIAAVLTDEQRQAFERLADRRGRGGHRDRGPGGCGGPQGPDGEL
jgi:protein CpxP